jgi:hypothetical protein
MSESKQISTVDYEFTACANCILEKAGETDCVTRIFLAAQSITPTCRSKVASSRAAVAAAVAVLAVRRPGRLRNRAGMVAAAVGAVARQPVGVIA